MGALSSSLKPLKRIVKVLLTNNPLRPGFGMRRDHRVLDFGLCGIAASDVHRALCGKPIRSRSIRTTRAVHRVMPSSMRTDHDLDAVSFPLKRDFTCTGEDRVTLSATSRVRLRAEQQFALK